MLIVEDMNCTMCRTMQSFINGLRTKLVTCYLVSPLIDCIRNRYVYSLSLGDIKQSPSSSI